MSSSSSQTPCATVKRSVDQPQLVHVGGERGAVALVAGDHLHLGFRDMGVEADVVLLGEIAAGDQERIAAVMRDGGGEGELHHLERPLLQRLLHLLCRRFPRRHLEAFDFLLQGRRQAIHKAGNGFEEGEVRHHRRQHAAHADLLVGLGHRRQAFDRGQRELGREVVSGSAALQHHLRRADHRRQILVLEIAPGADPLACRQQQLERPAIVQPLGEVARPVGVRIDQPGMHQAMPRIDHSRTFGRGKSGTAYFGDGVASHEDIGRRGLML